MVQTFVTVLSTNLKPINYHVLDYVHLYLRHYGKERKKKKKGLLLPFLLLLFFFLGELFT